MDAFSDLAFFALLNQHGSMAATAQQMGLTPPAVSRRLAALEARLGVRLMNRSTRRISLTPEGETYLVDGARVLADLQSLERRVGGAQGGCLAALCDWPQRWALGGGSWRPQLRRLRDATRRSRFNWS